MTVSFHIDPRLPSVSAEDLTCTCGQTFHTILEHRSYLPARHFITAVNVEWGAGPRHSARIERFGLTYIHHPDVCPTTKDDMSTLIYRAQRAAAGLGPPCPLPRSGAAWQPPPRRHQPKPPKPAPLSTIDKMIAETRRTNK